MKIGEVKQIGFDEKSLELFKKIGIQKDVDWLMAQEVAHTNDFLLITQLGLEGMLHGMDTLVHFGLIDWGAVEALKEKLEAEGLL